MLRGSRTSPGAQPFEPPAENLPRHVAIIMDGNGRWAKRRGLPRQAGHRAGTEALREIIRACDELRIEALTIYAFSTENWSRSEGEVGALMALLLAYFASEIDELHQKGVRIRILGDVDGLPAPQRDAVVSAMARTAQNGGLKLNIALNYGGRAELVQAARALMRGAMRGELDPDSIGEGDLAARLYTAGLPDVDLVIRTSGEMRLSNFLPYQTTYAELVFEPALWPDYGRAQFYDNLREYARRERRHGNAR
ncbi:MAG: di-trans,poly-cis-decaprenylcistransferase [Clostridiales bacterium]|nr:di-trans,poly-cis-decaprenylcistransferase [Clostridiales bacterium]